MVNELAGLGDGIDTWELKQDINKISEDAKKKVATDSKQAKKTQKQIQQSKQENNNLANFLTFLLKDLSNEVLVSQIYTTFFKTYNTKKNTTYLRKNINTIVIVWFFAPFYWDKIQEYHLNEYFKDLYNKKKPLNIHSYLDYIKALSQSHHDNIPINSDHLLSLLLEIINEYGLNQHHSLSKKTPEEIKIFFSEELGL